MIKKLTLLTLGMLIVSGAVIGQVAIPKENIPTLNRIAQEYDTWKWVFGITASVIGIWSFFGLKFFVKSKAEEWIMQKIAKEANLGIEHLRSAISEYSKIAALKKKTVWVISAAQGQQANVKKVFDACGFAYDDKSWVHVDSADSLVLGNVDVLLINDQHDLPITEHQLESIIARFTTNVGYFYFGDKMINSKEYRQKYNIDLDFCNSGTRLETGLLSLLKIR